MSIARRSLPFHWVDVFAVEPLTGNPLAVVEGGENLHPTCSNALRASSISPRPPLSCGPLTQVRTGDCAHSRRRVSKSLALATMPSAPGGGWPRRADCRSRQRRVCFTSRSAIESSPSPYRPRAAYRIASSWIRSHREARGRVENVAALASCAGSGRGRVSHRAPALPGRIYRRCASAGADS